MLLPEFKRPLFLKLTFMIILLTGILVYFFQNHHGEIFLFKNFFKSGHEHD